MIAANVRALRVRDAASPVLERYAEAARILTGRADATPEESAEWVGELGEALAIPGLATHWPGGRGPRRRP